MLLSEQTPLRILFVVPYTPTLVRVRPYNLIRSLAKAGHQVTVVTLYENERERSAGLELARDITGLEARPLQRWRSLANCVLALPSRSPLQSVYCWEPATAAALYQLLGSNGSGPFDVLHVEHLRGARYAFEARRRLGPTLPVVWDSVDSITLLFRQASRQSRSLFGRWMTRLELPRTERYEGQAAAAFDHVLVTSEKDRAALAELAHRFGPNERDPRISVLPNGVDLAYFGPAVVPERGANSLVVSGKMSYHANVTMVLYLVREVMPLVWAHRPDVRLTVVGKDPAREIRALEAHPNIAVTGTVADMRPYLQNASVAVAPLAYGAGIQNKVLEAMACGTPVVTTSQAAGALLADPGRHFEVADRAQDFADAILGLLADPARRAVIGAAGRTYVEEHHDWDKIAGRLAQIYRAARDAVRPNDTQEGLST